VCPLTSRCCNRHARFLASAVGFTASLSKTIEPFFAFCVRLNFNVCFASLLAFCFLLHAICSSSALTSVSVRILVFSALDTLDDVDLRRPAFGNGFSCSGVTSVDDSPAPALSLEAPSSSVMLAEDALPD